MASDREIAAQRRMQARESAARRESATQRPGQSSGGGTFQGAAEPAPRPSAPAVDPYAGPGMEINAEKMGGAVEDPNADTIIEIGPDMKPRRVPRQPTPGPQSMSPEGSFGDMIASSDAGALVNLVRQDRLARRAAAQGGRTPTFGEVSENNRAMAADQAQMAPAEDEAAQQAQVQEIAKNIRFVVDTRTGEFEPVLPGEADPQIGPTDIFIALGDDPTQPNILAQGKRVTSADIARLGDPKRAVQPALRSSYKVPEQYAGLAEALGLKTEGAA